MSKPTTGRKIGGEYGDVRAAIDVDKLNAYLKSYVPEVVAPVTVKQFKVCTQGSSHSQPSSYDCVGLSLDRCVLASRSPPYTNLTSRHSVESNLFFDGREVRRLLRPSEQLCSSPMYYRGKKSVLRKKPAGQLLSSTAHQVEREYRVLNALYKHNIKPGTPPEKRVPVPQPYAICEDCSILVTPFYIMEFVDGRIFTDPYMPQLDPKDRREWCVSSFVGLSLR